ncbi:MAG: sulfatase-like hydrolase/transferase [Rhodothermaceae bacterium]|nr:sulfatase-like hydrolase/transferase [Rhodothermaceae bacterium]MXZ57693.1 sulfatase-like hydrolase/transferase [Rhodothermaceae bacterium]MYB91353.1 sulfatase-like hydrolase/transferase [Rhodothermaceae bacterium]MYD68794.1 sulfatase-like hydrolase/transferase [Rhodothermaceae bacterium]MYG45448.1 sulfatase-like hydrolase/transferase [Rhodothermaceae bacterium]
MQLNTQNVVILLLGLCFLGSAGEKSVLENRSEPAKPKIVLIYIDDLGWADVGFNGSSYYETPNIDQLANQGIIFPQAYANAPNCAPSRASVMTGQYTPRHKVYTVGTSERGQEEDRRMIPVPNTESTTRPCATDGSLRYAGHPV